jgi:hypothetical protein
MKDEPSIQKYEKSPYYDFLLDEGIKARDRSAASSGMLLSGAQQKDIERYGQDYAKTDYDNYLRRYYDSLVPYQSMASMGQAAASNQAANAMTVGGTGAQMMNQTGANIANTRMQGAAAAGNALGTAGQARAEGQMNAIMLPYQHNMNVWQQGREDYWNRRYLNAQRRRDTMGLFGNFFQAIGSAAGASSDRRLKENIEPLGMQNGYKIYKFNYKGDSTTYVGVIAQEVMEKTPEAVITMPNGFYGVKYNLLGFDMVTYDQWRQENGDD